MPPPQKLYQLATLYTLSGAAMGVYAMTCVGGWFGAAVDWLALILSLLMAVGLYLTRPEKVPWWNPVHFLLISINGSLIFIHAIGFNAATHAFPTSQTSKSAKASLFPSFDAVPWFPPADQLIAAQGLARTAKEVLTSVERVRGRLDDLIAPIRQDRSRLEKQMQEERSSLETRLRDQRSEVEQKLEALMAERERLEKALDRGVHPAEREWVEKRLADIMRLEMQLKDQIVAHELQAQKMRTELDAKEKKVKRQLADLVAKETRLTGLTKEAAPILEDLKRGLHTSQKQLNESVQDLDRSYASIRSYSSKQVQQD